MALKNKSMYAILGVLNLEPCTGYDIKKYSDQVLSGFWNENFGHIYPTLKKMLADGMIEIAVGENTEKKVLYSITSKGKKELEAWLVEETTQQPVRSELMLKLFYSSEQPNEKIIEMMEQARTHYQTNLENYRKMLREIDEGVQAITDKRALFYKAVLRKGVLTSVANIRWCDETIEDFTL